MSDGLDFRCGWSPVFRGDPHDRWFIKEYYSASEVGIYALGYRFGEIMTFVVTAFQLSCPQFIFRNQKQENAPEL
ncbi:MAG: hypothetical protein CMJ81_13385 [Planctomycetaceae bacterium]|jgi:O-antigen/teichoic acid export membrane protein|nr:hypothetical protein [Planctomycetaceae bacterium]MBP60546.1 hypothetical protein [Planctomycetaceae bacterium]